MVEINIRGHKTKQTRVRKSIKEKIENLAHKKFYEILEKDEDTQLRYIKKIYGIEIEPEQERETKRLLRQAKNDLVRSVGADLTYDPKVRAGMRDKMIGELLGPEAAIKSREKDNRRLRSDPEAQLKKIKRALDQYDEIKSRFGSQSNNWTKVFENPEVVKALLGLVYNILGIQPINQDNINNALPGPDVVTAIPAVGLPKEAAVNPNNTNNAGDGFWPFIEKIATGMQHPAGEYADQLLQTANSGNNEAKLILEFIKANDYASLLNQISIYRNTIKSIDDNVTWYGEVRLKVQNLLSS
jgi:hypothetical protein